jgi:hypothetical protein
MYGEDILCFSVRQRELLLLLLIVGLNAGLCYSAVFWRMEGESDHLLPFMERRDNASQPVPRKPMVMMGSVRKSHVVTVNQQHSRTLLSAVACRTARVCITARKRRTVE